MGASLGPTPPSSPEPWQAVQPAEVYSWEPFCGSPGSAPAPLGAGDWAAPPGAGACPAALGEGDCSAAKTAVSVQASSSRGATVAMTAGQNQRRPRSIGWEQHSRRPPARV